MFDVATEPKYELPHSGGAKLTTATTTVKKTDRSRRIWIEGKKLTNSGFVKGSRFFLRHRKNELQLELDDDGDREITSVFRQGVERPVLKLDTQIIGQVFEVGDEVEATFYEHGIVFRRPLQSAIARLLQKKWVPEPKGDFDEVI